MIDILDEALYKALMDDEQNFFDIMNSFGIGCNIIFDFPVHIRGLVYISCKNRHHIILNGALNYESQCRTFLHEVRHILNDAPKRHYFIGLDMQHEEFEIDANKIVI